MARRLIGPLREYNDGLFEISDEDLTFDLANIFASTFSTPYSPLFDGTQAGVFEAPLIKSAAHETLETGIDLDLTWSTPAIGAPEAPSSAWNPYSSHYTNLGRDIYGEAREDRKASVVVRRASFSRRPGYETETPRHPRILGPPLESRDPSRCALAQMDAERRYVGNRQFPGASAKKVRDLHYLSPLSLLTVCVPPIQTMPMHSSPDLVTVTDTDANGERSYEDLLDVPYPRSPLRLDVDSVLRDSGKVLYTVVGTRRPKPR
ncbi:hypothetical protein EYR40_001625 [Pleurotus pulmonarius]|nr:hypothetical protein EYR38_004871 [Pleurotus pulmonarius]KAF4609271.1 hypothetical protein EYR40_001625 [Pleurotus pulmonarius]